MEYSSNETKYTHIHLAETDSTNSYARREASSLSEKNPGREILIITADKQTSGRGQRGTVWQSADGENLLMTIIIRPNALPINSCYSLSVAAALALKKSMQQWGITTTLKWPNDLYCNGCKLAGILLETDCEGANVAQAFIGIGLNVNQTNFEKMSRRPTSMALVCDKKFNVKEVMHTIVTSFIEKYTAITNGGICELFEEYEKSLMGYSTPQLYRDANGEFTATVEGVERDGCIQLRCSNGELRSYYFKEVENVILGY